VKRLIILLCSLLAIPMLGCDSGPSLQKAGGTLTLKGSPAPENTRVNFEPIGEGMSAAGIVDATGKFELLSGNEGLPGAMIGKYKVFVTADSSSSDYMDNPNGRGVPGVGSGPFPPEFTSLADTPIQKEVVKGTNDFVIDIP
jgi:hypothetical protein